jgi:hypothetical protein
MSVMKPFLPIRFARAWCRFSVALAVLSMAGTPLADTINVGADLQQNPKTIAYLNSRNVLEVLFRLGLEQDRKFGLATQCKGQYKIEPYSVAVLTPIAFPDETPHPVEGLWNIRYRLLRCGETKVYNTLFSATGYGKTPPAPRINFPGSTNAGQMLVTDALRAAMPAALTASGQKDCKQVDLYDMRVTEGAREFVEAGKTVSGVWDEIWTFRVCGKAVDAGLRFFPMGEGAGVHFKLTVPAAKPS